MKHIARKRFGQNFLRDDAVIDAIVQAIAPEAGQPLVEIGPGLMALTRPLLQRAGRLTVIELDRDLVARLHGIAGLDVLQGDVLKVDLRALAVRLGADVAAMDASSGNRSGLRIVGNLPYNISSPILFHLLDFVDVVRDQHFMLQKEVVDRMVAAPATADYGRLTVMLQWRYAMQRVLCVPPECFEPAPKVHSAVVRMVPRPVPVVLDARLLQSLVQTAFSQRRKLLRHTLQPWLDERGYTGNFDTRRRAEEIPVDEYLMLAAALSAEGRQHATSSQPSLSASTL